MQAVKDVIKSGYAAAMCGSGALDAWLRFRPGRRRLTILNYHWIAPEIFADHLRALRRSYQIVPLDVCEAVLRGDPATPPNAVAITFDDAYRQFHDQIVPVLRQFNAPATLFVPTQSIDEQRPIWCNVVKACVYALPDGLLEVGAVRIPVSGARRQVYHAVIRELNGMPIGPRDEAMAVILKGRRSDPEVRRKYEPMTWQQLRALPPSIGLGGHSVSHANLAALTDVDVRREVATSRRRIESRTWRPVRHFAYPFGQPLTVTPRVAEAVRDAGLELGLTTAPGTVGPESDPFLSPRLVCDDIPTGQILAARISRLWVRLS